MKNHLILSSKILTGIFLVLCTIGIVGVLFHNEPEITVSGYYIIPFAIITILTVLLFFIMFIYEMIAVIKENDKGRIIKLIAEIFLIIILGMATDMFIFKNKTNIIIIGGLSIGVCMISFALQFWKRKTA